MRFRFPSKVQVKSRAILKHYFGEKNKKQELTLFKKGFIC